MRFVSLMSGLVLLALSACAAQNAERSRANPASAEVISSSFDSAEEVHIHDPWRFKIVLNNGKEEDYTFPWKSGEDPHQRVINEYRSKAKMITAVTHYHSGVIWCSDTYAKTEDGQTDCSWYLEQQEQAKQAK